MPERKAKETWDKLKSNPAAIIAVASVFGISAAEIKPLLEADVPGWAAVAVGALIPLLYAAFAQARELVAELRGIRADLSTVEEIAAVVPEHAKAIQGLHGRVGIIEDVLTAEIAAHRENIRRDTDKVDARAE